MAERQTIGGDGDLFNAEDKDIKVHVTTKAGVPVDVSGWTTKLVVKADESSEEELIELDGTVEGVYDADPDDNTQRLVFSLEDTDTADLEEGSYVYSIRRTDDGSGTVLAFGRFVMELAAIAD